MPEYDGDELERGLRATFDRLAAGVSPTTDLVERTVERGAQLRRHRRIAAASAFVVVALAVTAGASSIAGAGTHHAPIQVSGPGGGEPGTATTTTSAPAPPIGVGPAALVPTKARRTRTVPPAPAVTPTTVAETPTTIVCSSSPPAVDDTTGTLTPNADGSITVTFDFDYDARRKKLGWALDDGTAGFGTLTKTYTPDQFGAHSFVEWSVDATTLTYVDCPTRHNFTVGSAPTTTTTGPETTTTTIPSPVP